MEMRGRMRLEISVYVIRLSVSLRLHDTNGAHRFPLPFRNETHSPQFAETSQQSTLFVLQKEHGILKAVSIWRA
jgi:hypothetical protein